MASNWPAMAEQGPVVSESSVATFEAAIGAKLPEDYRAFLLDVNGGQTSRSHRVFDLRKFNGRASLNSLYSLDDPDDRFNLATRQLYPKYPKNDLPMNALAIGSDNGGSQIVLILSGQHRGEIWYLDCVDPRPEGSNPRVEWFDRRDVAKLADSFGEFMASLRPVASVNTGAPPT